MPPVVARLLFRLAVAIGTRVVISLTSSVFSNLRRSSKDRTFEQSLRRINRSR